jgi:hypothetical protein
LLGGNQVFTFAIGNEKQMQARLQEFEKLVLDNYEYLSVMREETKQSEREEKKVNDANVSKRDVGTRMSVDVSKRQLLEGPQLAAYEYQLFKAGLEHQEMMAGSRAT